MFFLLFSVVNNSPSRELGRKRDCKILQRSNRNTGKCEKETYITFGVMGADTKTGTEARRTGWWLEDKDEGKANWVTAQIWGQRILDDCSRTPKKAQKMGHGSWREDGDGGYWMVDQEWRQRHSKLNDGAKTETEGKRDESRTGTDSKVINLREALPNRICCTKIDSVLSKPPFEWLTIHDQSVDSPSHALHFIGATYLLHHWSAVCVCWENVIRAKWLSLKELLLNSNISKTVQWLVLVQ